MGAWGPQCTTGSRCLASCMTFHQSGERGACVCVAHSAPRSLLKLLFIAPQLSLTSHGPSVTRLCLICLPDTSPHLPLSRPRPL